MCSVPCILSAVNIIIKYADDLLLPSESDTDVVSEFDSIKKRSARTEWKSVITENSNTCFFWLPNHRLVIHPMPLDEQVRCAKLLAMCLGDTLEFEAHLVNALNAWSWFTTLPTQRRFQGMLYGYMCNAILVWITYCIANSSDQCFS